MAYIDYVPDAEAGERLRRIRDKLREDGEPVDNILRIHSVNPPALLHHLRLYEHAMRGPSPLSEAQREMIAVVVSAANDCFY
jgi:alkylhydroperoxidase family enzyme